LNKKHRYWWPLELSDRLESELLKFEARLAIEPVYLDLEAVASAEALIAAHGAGYARTAVARDNLPTLCHLFVGWGNSILDGRPMLDRLAPFVHRDAAGNPYIYQCHPEGDYHPWQSFAYLAMAGVDPDTPIGELPVTLRQVALHSTVVRTSSMEDLGHLLFSFAEMGMPPDQTFTFRGKLFKTDNVFDLAELVREAVNAHHHGPFYVCRKIHLTEGLCAIVARVPELAPLRPIAQKFLDGQMDVLLTLALSIDCAEAVARGEASADECGLDQLRKALLIGSLLENHLYEAGHLVELASFAMRCGYSISPAHRNAIHLVFNHLNKALTGAIDTFAPMAVFLPFSHYRRALTLYTAMQSTPPQEVDRELLAAYRTDFDVPPQREPGAGRPTPWDGLYTRAAHTTAMRPFFEDVLTEFSQANTTSLECQGGFQHFRRLHPSHWPRQLHYEFLDYRHHVGVELHMEDNNLVPLLDLLMPRIGQLGSLFPNADVEAMRHPQDREAKLRVYFGETAGAVEIARSMNRFVEFLQPLVDDALADPTVGIDRLREVAVAGTR